MCPPPNDISADGRRRQVSWAYNWGQTASGSLPDGVMFLPMLWSDSDSFTSTWSSNAQSAIDNGAEFLMGCVLRAFRSTLTHLADSRASYYHFH